MAMLRCPSASVVKLAFARASFLARGIVGLSLLFLCAISVTAAEQTDDFKPGTAPRTLLRLPRWIESLGERAARENDVRSRGNRRRQDVLNDQRFDFRQRGGVRFIKAAARVSADAGASRNARTGRARTAHRAAAQAPFFSASGMNNCWPSIR